MDMLINLIVGIISQHICVLNHDIVYLKKIKLASILRKNGDSLYTAIIRFTGVWDTISLLNALIFVKQNEWIVPLSGRNEDYF